MTTRWRSIDTRLCATAVERRGHLCVCRRLRDVRGRADVGLPHAVMPDERTQANDNSLRDPRFRRSADCVTRSVAATWRREQQLRSRRRQREHSQARWVSGPLSGARRIYAGRSKQRYPDALHVRIAWRSGVLPKERKVRRWYGPRETSVRDRSRQNDDRRRALGDGYPRLVRDDERRQGTVS